MAEEGEDEVDDALFDFQNDKVLDADRGYTDVPWLALALCIIASSAVLSWNALEQEQTGAIVSGMDWRGHKCGMGDLLDAPLRGWVNPTTSFNNIDAGAVCLKKCPITSNGGQVSKWGTIMCVCNAKIDKDVSNPLTPLGAMCSSDKAKKYGYVFSNTYSKQSDISSYVTYTDAHKRKEKTLACTFQFTTHQIMNMCLPALDALSYELIVAQSCGPNGGQPCGLKETLSAQLNDSHDIMQRTLADVSNCWIVILLCCICGIVFACVLFFIVQQEWGTPVMLWSNVLWLAVLAVCASSSSDYFLERAKFSPELASAPSDIFVGNFISYVSVTSGILTVVMLVSNMMFSTQAFKLSQISIEGLDVADEDAASEAMNVSTAASRTLVLAGKAISLVPSLLISVIVQVIFTLALLGCWFAIAFAILSAAQVVQDTTGTHHLIFSLTARWGLAYHMLCFLWMMELIDVIVTIIGGGVIAVYVFAPVPTAESDDRWVPHFPLWHSFTTVGRFHLGTMVAGATMLMISRPLRMLTDSIHWLRYGSGVPNARWDTEKPDPDTWLGSLEIFYHQNIQMRIRGIDKRALIQTVLHGTPFLSATTATWHLNKHYGKYMAVPLYSSSIAMLVTRNNIALSCTIIGHILIMSESFGVDKNSLQSSLIPLVVIFSFGHVIGWAFLCHLDAAVVTEMVGYAEAKLRLYTPGVPQLTVPKDLILLCEEAQVPDADSKKGSEETPLVET